MRKSVIFTIMFFFFMAEAALLLIFLFQDAGSTQDVIAVNEILHSLQDGWDSPENYETPPDLDYVVLDLDGSLLFRTREGLSESLNQAVRHRDTILDINVNGSAAGKLILFNNTDLLSKTGKYRTVSVLFFLLLLQWGICACLLLYLNRRLVKPFRKLEAFAQRIAGGNLDIPLEMDRHNLFGAFTEGFDLMRSELKKARIAEAKANASKKELIAKLSHDIRTPVASIKAAAEVGAALMDNAADPCTASPCTAEPLQTAIRNNYTQIIQKADQINILVTNLFTATLEELQQLPVIPVALESRELKQLLENSDYLRKSLIPPIPDCLVYGDRLRLQQVFDNLYANSYKYAATEIEITISRTDRFLAISLEDFGGGVDPEELPFLKEKYRRGSRAKDMDGAGLGLYLSDYFMQEMQGNLTVENGRKGLAVTVMIKLFQI